MASEWPLVQLGDISDLFDGPHQTAPLTSGGPIVYLNVGDIRGGRIELRLSGRVSEETARLWSRGVVPEAGDVVFGYEATLGQAALLSSAHRWCLGRRVGLLRPRRDRVDPRFLAYSWYSPRFQETLRANRIGGSTIESIRLTDLPSWHVALPTLDEQRAVGRILGTLDDKIELNRRMSETLDSIARALFKSWFIDFDPVRAKAEGRDLGLPPTLAARFPASFEQSVRGEIPAGWPVVSLGALCRRVAMGPFGSDITTDNFVESGVPVVRGRNLTNGFVEEGFVFVSEAKADELRNANAFPGDIVITHRGTLGQVGLIPMQSRHPRYVVSQSQLLLSVHPDRSTSRYVFEFLRSRQGQHALLANTSQTGVPAIARPTSSVKAIEVLQPSGEVLASFDRLLDPIMARIDRANDQTRTLVTLRESLLPRLMSGQLSLTGEGAFGVPNE